MIGPEEQEVFAIGQELRPTVSRVFAPFKLRQAYGSSACRTDLPQGIAVIGLVDDHVVLIPRTSPRIRRVSQDGDRASRRLYLLHASVGEESNPLSISRPEGERGTVCS